ncbi:MAG TPA: SbcC/MukB-like Walker B domain-containing protein, partial [Thermomicrobiales bacterium]|nr:SbcC/MukB-like Walker B domain-containing protein [Thermomicrobiales bacterium]
IGYDAEAARHAARMERDCAPFAERKAGLDEARAGASQAEALIAEISTTIAERERNHAESLRSLEQMRQDNPRDPSLRDRCDAAADAVSAMTREKNALIERQGRLQGRIADLDRLQDRRDDLDKDATALALDHGATKALVDAFGRNGIQAMIVEGVLPELEDETNRLLRQMSSSQLEVSFRSQRQAQSRDSIIETLDIIIRDEAGERPYSLFSGGEAFRVNFAVRVALSKLLARRAGASIDMLVIDEGFGTQDSRGRDGLIEALRSIEGDFRTILVITHIGEIRELFPTRIDVVKTERGSQVTVS